MGQGPGDPKSGRHSIPAQRRSLQDYALQHDMVNVEEFVDVETAKRSGRIAFTAMLEYLKKHHPTCRTIRGSQAMRLGRRLVPNSFLSLGPFNLHDC